MRSITTLLCLLSSSILLTSTVHAAGTTALARVICTDSNNGDTGKSRSLFMLANPESIKNENGLISVSGSVIETKGTGKIQANECKMGYQKKYTVKECTTMGCMAPGGAIICCEWKTVTKTKFVARDWNALVVNQKPTLISLVCGVGSSVEIYQERADFIGDFLENIGAISPSSATGVTARSCFIDRF